MRMEAGGAGCLHVVHLYCDWGYSALSGSFFGKFKYRVLCVERYTRRGTRPTHTASPASNKTAAQDKLAAAFLAVFYVDAHTHAKNSDVNYG